MVESRAARTNFLAKTVALTFWRRWRILWTTVRCFQINNLMPGFSSIVSYEPSGHWYWDVSDFTGKSSMNGMVWCGILSRRMNAMSA